MEDKTQLESLLLDHFGPQAVNTFIVQPLSSNGQHFTSCIDKVKVFLEEENEKLEINLIIKTLPSKESDVETNSKMKFMKEIRFYQLALPEYRRIQAMNNLPEQKLFPLFYTASEEIIIFEDMSSQGYYLCEKYLSKVQTKLVLQELAKFHATGIALKLSSPKIFEEQLATVVTPALRNASNPDSDEINLEFRLEINQTMRSNDDLHNHAEAVDTLLKIIDDTKLPVAGEPFSTLLHNDLWRGNIMFKDSPSNGGSFNVKFIDFQTVIFNSPARDLIYFLFSSAEENVLSEFSDLLKFYHFHFVNYLSDLKVDSSEYTFDKFMFEINSFGPTKLKHLLLLFKALCSVHNEGSSFENYLRRVVTLFKERGWI